MSASGPSRPPPSPGIYFAHLVRDDDTGDDNQILFVVRNDASHSDRLFQTSDTTWQAYNDYGGNSLYVGAAGRAAPTRSATTGRSPTRGDTPGGQDFFIADEYPMIRWLESQRLRRQLHHGRRHRPPRRAAHEPQGVPVGRARRVLVGPQRANVDAARDAGVNLAFFSGNEVFWKTRWETSIDGSSTTLPHAGHLQGDPRQRQDRPHLGPGPAPGVTRGSARRPTAASPRTR